MKGFKKNMLVVFLLLITVGATLLTLYQVPTVKADTTTDAITAALDWLDRMAYREMNSTHAVATDSPMLAFRCYRSDGYWTIFGKETNTNLPTSATMIRGGTTDPQGTTDDLNLITGEVNNQRSYFYWDMDGDSEYDDMTLYVEYATMDNDDTRLAVKVVQYANVGVTYNLQIETTTLISTVVLNAQASIDKQWGWQGARYTIRPTTKGLADLYYNLATEGYSWLGGQTYAQSRGVNYTDRALKLYRTWYGSGYILDRFDGHYGVTTNVRPFAGTNGIPNYPANPDLIKEPYLGVVPDGTSYKMSGASATDNWYNYNNVPSGFTMGLGNGVLRFTTVSRHVMPDEEWNNTPFWCDAANYAFNYRSRTSFSWARNTYIANGLDYDIKHYNNNPLPILGADVVLGVGTDAKAIRASHDMYKYGANVPYGLNTLKSEFLDTATWDGNGIAFDSWGGVKIGWEYPAYGTHNTATYGNALTQYNKLTSDTTVGEKADEVIGVLLMLQNKYGTPTYSRAREQYYYRPEFVGSFMPGYAVAYSYGQQDIYGASYTDLIYGALSYIGIFDEDVYPLAYPVMGNVECTIPSVWSLIEYKTTGRTPHTPSTPNYNLPFVDNGIAYIDHGGNNGGDGLSYFVGGDQTSTYIGGETGNRYRIEGNLGKMRLGAYGGNYGHGWSSIEYEWAFTLQHAVTDWRSKAYFTTPNYLAFDQLSGINNFDMDVYLYQGATLLQSDHRDLENDLSANSGASGTSGKMYVFTDLCQRNLDSGTYTVKLKFTVSATNADYYHIGYQCNNASFGNPWSTTVNAPKGLPMGLEHFGFDYDEIQEPNPPEEGFAVTFATTTGGTISSPSLGEHHYSNGQTITIQAQPFDNYVFSHWGHTGMTTIQNGFSPIDNLTVNGEGTVTAYFTYSPTLFYAYLSNDGHGRTIPDPENPLSLPYVCGHAGDEAGGIQAIPVDEGYAFSYWSCSPVGCITFADIYDDETTTVIHTNGTITAHFTNERVQVRLRTNETQSWVYFFPQMNGNYGDFTIGSNIQFVTGTLNNTLTFDHWTINDQPNTGQVTTTGWGTFAYHVAAQNAILTAHYKLNYLTATATAATGGTVQAPTTQTALWNTAVSFTAVPNANYHFTRWVKDELFNFNDPTYFYSPTLTFNIQSNTTCTAEFAINNYVTIQSTDINKGTVSPVSQYVSPNNQIQLFATDATGYDFEFWVISNGVNSTVTYTRAPIVTVTSDLTCTAHFIPELRTLTTSVSDSSLGTISPSAGGHAYNYGTTVTVTATPSTGNGFYYWLINGQYYAGTGSGVNTQGITLTADTTIQAVFFRIDYELVRLSGGHGHTEVDNLAPYYYGETVTFTAVPDTGYEFDHWLIDGTTVSYEAHPVITMNQGHAVMAYFRALPPPGHYLGIGYMDNWNWPMGDCLISIDSTEYYMPFGEFNYIYLTNGWHTISVPYNMGNFYYYCTLQAGQEITYDTNFSVYVDGDISLVCQYVM